jgi:hypothetical protein
MEGFFPYDVRVVRESAGIRLEVRPAGTRRDQYLGSHLRWILQGAGVDFQEAG